MKVYLCRLTLLCLAGCVCIGEARPDPELYEGNDQVKVNQSVKTSSKSPIAQSKPSNQLVGDPQPPSDPSAPDTTSSSISYPSVYLDSVSEKEVIKIPIHNFVLDDGLEFDFMYYQNVSNRVSPFSFTPPYRASGYPPQKLIVPDLKGGFNEVYANSGFIGSEGFSAQHLYTPKSPSHDGDYWPSQYTVYFPSGVKYKLKIDYHLKTANISIESPHGLSSVTYGRNLEYNITSVLKLSNGYTVNLTYNYVGGQCIQWRIENKLRQCLKYAPTSTIFSKAEDNHNATWQVNKQKGILRPDGLPLTHPNGQKYTFANNKLSYAGVDVAYPYSVSVSKSGNTTTVTQADGSKWIYTMLPDSSPGVAVKNQKGLYSKLVKQTAAGEVLYEEDNEWVIRNKIVPVLAKQTIHQDGVTTITQNENFNAFMYPETVYHTASDGSITTTKTTYFVLDKPDKEWHMVKPETITIIQDKNKGKVLSKVVNVYDNEDGTLQSSTVNGVKTTYTYDTKYNIASITNAVGDSWKYEDYDSGRPQRVIDPEGNITKYTYNYLGNVTSKTDALGYTTSYKYNLMGYLTEITPPEGNSTTITYSNDDRTVTHKRGDYTKVVNHDALGNVLNITESNGDKSDNVVIKHETDPVTNQSFVSYPARSLSQAKLGTVETKDILGRPVKRLENTTWQAGE